MIPAKKFGGKVTQYFIGFGPTVWSKQVGETEYGVKAIPLGGYVKIVGMLPPGAEELADEVTVRRPGQPGRPGPQVQHRHVHPADLRRPRGRVGARSGPRTPTGSSTRWPWWKKVIVMAGGPTVNLLIAFFIFAGVFATYGNPERRAGSGRRSIDRVAGLRRPARRGRPGLHAPSDPVSPGGRGRPAAGRRIVAFNGTAITDWDQLQRPDPRQRRRHGRDRASSATASSSGPSPPTPRSTPRPDLARPTRRCSQVGFLGVTPESPSSSTGGPSTRSSRWATMTVDTVKALGTLPVKVWGVAQGDRRASRSATPTARSASSAAAGSPARPSPHEELPGRREGRLPADADRRLQLLHRHVQLHPAAAARRRPHRRRAVGGAPPRRSPGCAAGPTPGTSTSPSCCRSRTSWPRACW